MIKVHLLFLFHCVACLIALAIIACAAPPPVYLLGHVLIPCCAHDIDHTVNLGVLLLLSASASTSVPSFSLLFSLDFPPIFYIISYIRVHSLLNVPNCILQNSSLLQVAFILIIHHFLVLLLNASVGPIILLFKYGQTLHDHQHFQIVMYVQHLGNMVIKMKCDILCDNILVVQ